VWAVSVPAAESEAVRLAAADLRSDIARITGKTPRIIDDTNCRQCVLVVSAARSPEVLKRAAPATFAKLRGKWEAYAVHAIPQGLLVAGSDDLGAAFGVYAFAERYLGVDPLYFWSGREPARREALRWEKVALEAGEPSFRYRGWFVNDEDLLTEWRDGGGTRTLDYPYYHQVVHPDVMARVIEGALRLQFNLIIPASFTDITNPPEERLVEAASRRGLHVSMHHVEPMGVSAFAFQNYWKRKGRTAPFVFHSQKAAFEETWRDFAARWSRYPNVVWQLGLRGIADRPAWQHDPSAPKTDAGRAAMISDAMALQWKIVREFDRRPHPPATTTLWMEGAEFNRQGLLKIPDGVTVVFSDNNPGWRMQADFYDTPREPRRTYGIYYHHALWGSGPHLVQGVPPWKTWEILKEAVTRQAGHYVVFNVSNVREFVLGLDATARMTRRLDSFDAGEWLREWCEARFPGAAPEAARAYRAFFDAYLIDERAGTPALLDGLTLHEGERLLARILKPPAPPARPARPAGESLGRYLPNLRGTGSWPLPVLIERVREQRRKMEEAAAPSPSIAARLAPADRVFFENNFVAQSRLLIGLLGWTEWVAAAAEAAPRDPQTAAAHLARALEAFAGVKQAQALASRGPWNNWYRGDDKMNLDRAERQTREALAMLSQKATQP
jgi:hypothetical protein